jgi:hypothetical protein
VSLRSIASPIASIRPLVVNRPLTIGAILGASPSSIIILIITEESAQAIAGASIRDRNIAGSLTSQSIDRRIGSSQMAKLEPISGAPITGIVAEKIRLRPQMLSGQIIIGAIAEIKTVAQIARGSIIGRTIAGGRIITTMCRMISGEIRTQGMRR